MRHITFTDPHRQRHFAFFNRMSHPHFNITVQADITPLLPFLRAEGLPFYHSMVWIAARAVHAVPQLRQRIRGGSEVVEHEVLRPSFTVATEASEVFSFCTVGYAAEGRAFLAQAAHRVAAMQAAPVMSNEPGADDYLFLSGLPWMSFTGIQHAMDYGPGITDSVPRITWGKYYEEGGRCRLPLACQAHHALVNGREMGLFFDEVASVAAQPALFF